MMTLTDLETEVSSLYEDVSDKLDRCEAFFEASMVEYKSNLTRAKLKVVQESGTTEDLAYLESEAEEGLIAKGKKTVVAIIESIKRFFKELLAKIKGFFSQKSVDDTLKKVDKAAKSNDKIRNMTIEVKDMDAVETIQNEFEAAAAKMLAKEKSKTATDRDRDEFKKAVETRNKKMAAVGGKVIGITTAVGLIYALHKKITNGVKKSESMLDKASDDATIDPEVVKDVAKASTDTMKIWGNGITGIFRKIREAFKGNSQLDTDEDPKEESVEDAMAFTILNDVECSLFGENGIENEVDQMLAYLE